MTELADIAGLALALTATAWPGIALAHHLTALLYRGRHRGPP